MVIFPGCQVFIGECVWWFHWLGWFVRKISPRKVNKDNMKKEAFTILILFTFIIDKNTSKARHHRKLPDLQRTHWYSLTSPTDTIPSPGEYVDYHLAPDPAPPPSFSSTHAPPSLHTDTVGNITSQLGQTVYFKCTVIGFRQGENTVSWTKTTKHTDNPIALTFNDKVGRKKTWIRIHSTWMVDWKRQFYTLHNWNSNSKIVFMTAMILKEAVE